MHGVVLIVGPWNYPFYSCCRLISAATWLPGTIMVLKGPRTNACQQQPHEKIISETFGADYILYLEGDGKEICPGLIRIPISITFFYREHRSGKDHLPVCGWKLLPVTLELGGNRPNVVTADANITVAAKRITLAKFFFFSNTRPDVRCAWLYIGAGKAYGALVDAITRCIGDFTGESIPVSDYGRVVNRAHIDRLADSCRTERFCSGKNGPWIIVYGTNVDDTCFHANQGWCGKRYLDQSFPILTYQDMAGAISIIRQNPESAGILCVYIQTKGRRTPGWKAIAAKAVPVWIM